MNSTPNANRLHIGIFGRRNAGKSSLINAITGQAVAVVADFPGTTTDPVYKPMELLPLGPVTFIDTGGLDDSGEVGRLRIDKALAVLRKSDLALLVVDGLRGLQTGDLNILNEISTRDIPWIMVINKADLAMHRDLGGMLDWDQFDPIWISAKENRGIQDLKERIINEAGQLRMDRSLVEGLVSPGDFVILVTPIDSSAPKNRLILPQQQTIRDLLDNDAIAIVTKEHELRAVIQGLAKRPALVITDSQAFLKVAADTPKDIPLTSFSILFAQQKGDLAYLYQGAKGVENLQPGDQVLIVEGCTHHAQADDIGKVKIPRWLCNVVGGNLKFTWVSGVDFPANLLEYQLIIHCGGCMLNRREVMWRINTARASGVPMVNYGVLIAYIQGILPRAMAPFGFAAEV